MLAVIFAAHYPALARKLVLVGSSVFDAAYAAQIQDTRRQRMTAEQRAEFDELQRRLAAVGTEGNDELMGRLGRLLAVVDAYDPLPVEDGDDPVSHRVYESVWTEAEEFRRSGQLLAAAATVRCPVVAIHGDHDPHPEDGVRVPLAGVISDFRFITIQRCGHLPWRERQAREEFLEALRREVRS